MRKVRMLAVLIALVMMLSSVSFAWAEDVEVLFFEPTLANMVELENAAEAMENTGTRAAISVFMAVDLLLEDIADVRIGGSSYIGRADELLYIYFHLADQDILVLYTPTNGQAGYMFLDTMPDSVVERAMEECCPDGYFLNDSDAMQDVLERFLALLSDD